MSTFVSNPRAGGSPSKPRRGRGSSMGTWRWSDRLVWAAAWAAGLSLCAVAAAILFYMGYRGIQYLRPELIFSRPQASSTRLALAASSIRCSAPCCLP